jgi:hypothetical protein
MEGTGNPMNAPLIPPWTPLRYIPRPSVMALVKPDARALVASATARVTALIVRFVALIETLRKEWRFRLYFRREMLKLLRQPVIGNTTDWCALPFAGRPLMFGGVAQRADVLVLDELRDYPADAPVALPVVSRIDTSPLVTAAARKEPAMLLKIAPSSDCLHVDRPVAVEPPAPAKAAPKPVEYWEKGVRKGASSFGILPTITPNPDDLKTVLYVEDGYGRKVAAQ